MSAVAENIKGLGMNKLIALAGVGVIFIFIFIALTMKVSGPVMSPLYASVEQSDTQYIIQELQKSGVEYKLGLGGTQILVPSDKILQMRMLMAQKGLPSNKSDVGYEIFDKTEALGTSSFVLNVNKLRALEGELSRTINSFSTVSSARVHLVIPKRELFSRQKNEPTASVALRVLSTSLSKQEIAAIRHLVATAVPGLKPSRITIVDNKGLLLARGIDDPNDPEYLAETSADYRKNYEKKTKAMLESLLEETIGMNKVIAEVTADIDFDRITTNSETFDPESQVARSVQNIEETETSDESESADNVSVGQNLPDANASSGGISNKRNTQRIDETTNFEISKTVSTHVKETGKINKLSVAILVDGIYAENADGDLVYNSRTDDELAQIKTLVASAIGFDEKRGDLLQVVNMKFAHGNQDVFEEDALAWLKEDLNNIIQTTVLGGVAILVILLVIRPLVSRAIEASQATQEDEELEQSLLSGTGILSSLPDLSGEAEDDEMISISNISGGIKSSAFRKITDMIETYPDETLNVIRQWAFHSNK